MRCPKCSSVVPCSDKAACRECDYRFGLDPRQPHRLSDADYLTLVDQASAGRGCYFTQNQLYFYYCIEQMPQNLLWPFAGIIAGALGHHLLGTRGAVMGAIATAGLVYYGTKAWRPPPRSVLDNLHEEMKAAGHPIKRLISKPLFEFRAEEKYTDHLPHQAEIEQVIVVNRDSLVDLLVLNDFPKRVRALIVSQSGYPNYVIPVVKEMLEKRKSLAIYLLHDSTENRLMMKRKLSNSQLLPINGHRMFNLGIDPEQVTFMKRLTPIQPSQSSYRIPLDSIPYPILDAALTHSILQGVPLLTAFATIGFVGKK